MDLQLLGTAGVIGTDDFVLDWANSFAFRNRELKVGYSHRTGMATRKETVFVPTPASTAQEMAMVETFAELAVSGEIDQRAHYIEAFTQDTRVSGCAVGSGEPVSRHWVAKSDQTPPEWD